MCREDGVYFMSKQIDFKNRDRFIQLGIAISALRKMRGMSQEQLAEKLNISTSNMSKIEIGYSGISIDLMIELAFFFKVSFEYILLGEE